MGGPGMDVAAATAVAAAMAARGFGGPVPIPHRAGVMTEGPSPVAAAATAAVAKAPSKECVSGRVRWLGIVGRVALRAEAVRVRVQGAMATKCDRGAELSPPTKAASPGGAILTAKPLLVREGSLVALDRVCELCMGRACSDRQNSKAWEIVRRQRCLWWTHLEEDAAYAAR